MSLDQLIFKVILFIILLNGTSSSGQNITHYHYGLDNGLSQETIRTIAKDSSGFLWIGTQDGLNRFDGNVFKVYKHNPKDTLSLHENYINTLYVGSDKKIWVGTSSYGLSYYDEKKDAFYKVGPKLANCKGITEMANGIIVAALLDGDLAIFSKDGEKLLFATNSFFKTKNLSLTDAVYSKTEDCLYLATSSGKLFKGRFNKGQFTFNAIKYETTLSEINTLLLDGNTIWIGTALGLFNYNLESKKLTPFRLNKTNQNYGNKLFIESLALSNNVLHVGTDYGYYQLSDFNDYNDDYKTIQSYLGDLKDNTVITSNRVYDILVDSEFIWIGTNKLDAISQERPVFNLINTKTKSALNNNHVFSILKTKDFLFLGTRNGLNCIDNNGKVTVITRENTGNQLAYNVIRNLLIDRDNNLWVATTKGISVIDLTNFRPDAPSIKSMYHNPEDVNSISTDKTRGLFLDKNNTIWVTTYGGGINRFTGNIENNIFTFQRYKNQPNGSGLASNIAFNIVQDKSDTYWITTDNGITTIDFEPNYQNPEFNYFVNKPKDEFSLNNNGTLHTFKDSENILWIATQDGLHKYLGNQQFMRYGISDGLTNTFVYAVLEDKDGILWLSTNGGIFSFNPISESFTNYTVNDGLQSSEFNLGAQYNDMSSNTLYFGGVKGCNFFNPQDVTRLDREGQLLFTALSVKDTAINPLKHPYILKENIISAKNLSLNYDDFPTNLAFSELDFRGNKNNQFVYRLLPDNKTWSNLTSQNLQLIGLSNGEYTLQIQGKSRNKLWTRPPLELAITVSPPWYKSNLAYLSYLLLFLGIVYAFYRISLQRQIAGQESKRLQDLDDLKSRFITNITHEFRTPLTIILGYLGNLKERFTSKDEVSTSLETIEQNSNNLLDLVNQMLDLAKLEKGQLNINLIQNDIVAFSSHIVDSFKSISTDKDVHLKFSAEPNKIIMDFDAEKIRQILTNLISNAIKFSPKDSELNIRLNKKDTSTLQIIVADEGYGISEEELPFIFDRFYQVENTEHKVSQGTGVGLALTKDLVELFEGRIKVTSGINKGTTFTITLPITNTAEAKSVDQDDRQMSIGTVVPEIDDIITDEDANAVLIVEDNADMARYIASCLKPDYKVTFAKDGKEGLKLATQNIPDIVVTDVMMPIIDGYELTQKLQGDANTNHIPIIMLTSKAMDEDRLEGITSGADAYLTKPFQKKELQLRMQKLIAKRKQLQERYAVNTIVEQKVEQPQPTDKNLIFLNSVIDAIHQNLDDSDFGATELAKFLAMSDSQLYRKLKAISNTSTAIFIRKVRLEKGKDMLKNNELSISEIAYAVGFNDPNYFSKTFKEEFQQSPTEFRN